MNWLKQWWSRILWVLAIIGWIVAGTNFGGVGAAYGFIGFIICSTLLIYFGLAPYNIFFTFKEEGTVKIVMRGSDEVEEKTPENVIVKVTKGGEAIKLLMQMRGYVADEDWDIVPGKAPFNWWGALCFVGVWPLDRIYSYTFEWTGTRQNGDIQYHPRQRLDYILIKDDIYWCNVENAEDYNLVPLNMELLLTLRIVNPYKALFVVQNWLELVINSVKPIARNLATSFSYKEAIQAKQDLSGMIFQSLQEQGFIEEARDRYGVEIRKIQIKEFDPREDVREATIKKWLGEMEADGLTASTAGSQLKMLMLQTGKELKTLQEEFEKSPATFIRKYRETLQQDLDIVLRNMGIKGNAFFEFSFKNPDGTSIEPALIALGARLFGKGLLGVRESKDEENKGAEEENTPGQKQGFWQSKKPMETIHKQKKKNR